MEAVTTPNPIAGTSVLTAATPHAATPAERSDLCRRYRANQHELAVHVLRGLERARRVVPAVEHDRAARADVLDLLACLQRGLARRESIHDRLAWSRLRHLHDVLVEYGRARA